VKGVQKMYEIFDNLLKLSGVSAYKVSKETGISQTTLSDWKRGRSIPKTDKLQQLADYFGVTLNYLLGNESFRYMPTKLNLRMRKILGNKYCLRVIVSSTCVCKELPNGYILAVACHSIGIDESCDADIVVWNYAFQPFLKQKVCHVKSVKRIKEILQNLEKEYGMLPRLKESTELSTTEKEGPTQNVQVRDEHDNIVVLDDETRDLIDSLRKNPEMKMLFSVSKGATKEDIIKTIKIIEALKDKGEEGDN